MPERRSTVRTQAQDADEEQDYLMGLQVFNRNLFTTEQPTPRREMLGLIEIGQGGGERDVAAVRLGDTDEHPPRKRQ